MSTTPLGRVPFIPEATLRAYIVFESVTTGFVPQLALDRLCSVSQRLACRYLGAGQRALAQT